MKFESYQGILDFFINIKITSKAEFAIGACIANSQQTKPI